MRRLCERRHVHDHVSSAVQLLIVIKRARLIYTHYTKKADYTVRPTGGADNLLLLSRASYSAPTSYAHLDGHH